MKYALVTLLVLAGCSNEKVSCQPTEETVYLEVCASTSFRICVPKWAKHVKLECSDGKFRFVKPEDIQ